MSSPIGKADYDEGAEGRLKVETIARIYAEKAQAVTFGIIERCKPHVDCIRVRAIKRLNVS